MTDARDELRRFLAERCRGAFRDDEPLMSSGRVNSLAAIQLMMFLEKRFGLDTSDPDFDATLLDSVDEILLLLTERA